MTHHAHTPLPLELSEGAAALISDFLSAVLTAHPDTRMDRATRHAISELREKLRKAGKVA